MHAHSKIEKLYLLSQVNLAFSYCAIISVDLTLHGKIIINKVILS